MLRRVFNINSKWCNFLPLEYWTNDGKHNGESDFHNYLLGHWNEFKWMFGYSIGNGYGRLLSYSCSNCISSHYLRRRVINTNRNGCDQLSMEHR